MFENFSFFHGLNAPYSRSQKL